MERSEAEWSGAERSAPDRRNFYPPNPRAVSILHLRGVICNTSAKRTTLTLYTLVTSNGSGDAVLTNGKLPRVASRGREVEI